MASTRLNVKGMKCGGCENSVKDGLSPLPGVIEVRPSHKEAVVEIDYDENAADPAAFKKVIADLGFTVED